MSETPGHEQARDPWSQETRDRWFFAALALSTFSLVYLFWPYVMVLLFSGVTVVVTWPIYGRIHKGIGDRPLTASLLTVSLLAVLVFGPVITIIAVAAHEAVPWAEVAIDFVKSGQGELWAQETFDQGRAWVDANPTVKEGVKRFIPEDFDPVKAVAGPVRDGSLALLNAAGDLVPKLIGYLFAQSINVVIFLFAVITLYKEGPTVLGVAQNLSPLDDQYETRLFNVFREFANNMVVGSLATAALQGVVAAIGYAVAGVEGVIFLGVCTAVLSFVPMVGTMVVWVPVSLWALFQPDFGWQWAGALALWNGGVTGSVDNLAKPLFLRGSTDIHPLLIFLAVFGGLAWFGLPGVLIGPVLVAFFLALYTIFKEDYLGVPSPPPDDSGMIPEWMVDGVQRLWSRLTDPPASSDEVPATESVPAEESESSETEADASASDDTHSSQSSSIS